MKTFLVTLFALVTLDACTHQDLPPEYGICITVDAKDYRGVHSICGPADKPEALEHVLSSARIAK